MGEKTWDVTAIDPKAYPAVEWDFENPARALQALAERFGCRVVYRWDTDSVLLARQGVGGPLPQGSVLYDSPSITPKPVPKKIIVASDYIRYQMRFNLEPVGMEFDGSWKPIDQLSYRPKDGWRMQGNGPPSFGAIAPGNLPGLPGNRKYQDAQALAQAYIYRAYRVALTGADGNGKLKIPADGTKDDECTYHKQLILLPNMAQVTQDDLHRRTPAPARVMGRHTPLLGYGFLNPIRLYERTDIDTEVRVPFSIDREHAIIMFSQYVYAYKPIPVADGGSGSDSNRAFYPAEIVLETACHFADNKTFQLRRRDFSLDVPGGLSPQPLYVVKEQLQATNVATYLPATNELPKCDDNDSDIKPRADYYLRGELAKFVTDAAETTKYSGVAPIAPDGLISQVSVQFAKGDKNCPSTTASANTEHSVYQPTYEGRRLREEADLRPQASLAEQRAKLDRIRKFDGGGTT
jgi:hypothetical protein